MTTIDQNGVAWNNSSTLDPNIPRWRQRGATEDFHVGMIRRGLSKEFTRTCQRLGIKNYAALERLLESFIATGVLPPRGFAESQRVEE